MTILVLTFSRASPSKIEVHRAISEDIVTVLLIRNYR